MQWVGDGEWQADYTLALTGSARESAGSRKQRPEGLRQQHVHQKTFGTFH